MAEDNNNSAMASQEGAIAPQEGGSAPRNPFQDLIGLPGIDSIQDIFDDADEGLGEGNPFAGNGAGGNPFGGVPPEGGAAPEGEMSGGNPFAGGGNPFAGGGAGGGNPFGGAQPEGEAPSEEGSYGDYPGDGHDGYPGEGHDGYPGEGYGDSSSGGGMPIDFGDGIGDGLPLEGEPSGMGGGNPFAGGGNPLDSITGQTEGASTPPVADGLTSPGEVPSEISGEMPGGMFGGMSSDLDALIRQSPFGVLLDLPTINGVEDIFGSLGMSGENPFAGGSEGGSNPFGGASGGNPFAGGEQPGSVGGEMSAPTV